jgi:hypothetical protein
MPQATFNILSEKRLSGMGDKFDSILPPCKKKGRIQINHPLIDGIVK